METAVIIFGMICSLIVGIAIGKIIGKPPMAGRLRITKDEEDGKYYLAADMDMTPSEIVSKNVVMFEVNPPGKIGYGKIAEISRDENNK